MNSKEIFSKAFSKSDYGRVQIKIHPETYVKYMTKLTPFDRSMVRERLIAIVDEVINDRIAFREAEDRENA